MTNARALTRVRQDLADGHPRAAVRRLRAMLAADPCNLEIYRMLSEIYRASGDAAEAGRWGYLTGDATTYEIEAFEHAHPQPWIRLQLVAWPGDPATLPDPAARNRLTTLQRRVTEVTIPLQRTKGRGGPQQAQHPQAPHPAPAGPRGEPFAARAGYIPTQRPPTTPVPGAATPLARLARLPRAVVAVAEARAHQVRLPRRRRPVQPQDDQRSRASTVGNYAILLFLIVSGTAGSLVAVVGLRALFGVQNSADPVINLVKTIIRTITG